MDIFQARGGISECRTKLEDVAVSPWNPNTWAHMAITWSGKTGEVHFYQNGNKLAGSSCTASATRKFTMPQPGKLVMFQEQDTFGGGFDANHNVNGGIDELRWWSTVSLGQGPPLTPPPPAPAPGRGPSIAKLIYPRRSPTAHTPCLLSVARDRSGRRKRSRPTTERTL